MSDLTVAEEHWLYTIADLGSIKKLKIFNNLRGTQYRLWGDGAEHVVKATVPADIFEKLMQYYKGRSDVFVEIKPEYHDLCNEYLDGKPTKKGE